MPMAILFDVLEKLDNFIFLADLVVLDYEVNFEITIILGRPFLATGGVLVDMDRVSLCSY